ncbi:hypothetical protein AMS68_001193 [Peltaster fructicola]|uniref:RRM domain-containing protein n=1 Tax=Peltaster fructicola TaxID=286661 RepID=A0A6H0XLU4_9PEZI|nr:hypothetical protein AMS68_001193 [Peltaster fructicola]
MDRSLDEIIGEKPRGGRGGRGGRGRGGREDRRPAPRAPRREEYPRDGINKQNRRDDRANIDTDWVHDRYEDDRYDARGRESPEYGDRRDAPRAYDRRREPETESAKLRVENIHYELTQEEVTELFARIGPLVACQLLYDRRDRSQGVAFVTYRDPRDAREAVREYNGANAQGQPIRLSLIPSHPPKSSGGSLFDRVESRSLFDRIQGDRDGGREDRRGGRDRSFSPRRGREDADRYASERRGGRGQRGGPRERGRRPGARREESAREGRKPRTDEGGRPVGGGRPRKTAEELDAEMADYFAETKENKTVSSAPATAAAGVDAAADDDIDMIS